MRMIWRIFFYQIYWVIQWEGKRTKDRNQGHYKGKLMENIRGYGENQERSIQEKKGEVQEEPSGPLCQVLLEGQIS